MRNAPLGTIDKDKTLGYETNSRTKKCLNVFIVPILNNIPLSLRSFVKKSHASAKDIIEKATTHEALEILYLEGEPHKTRGLLPRFFHSVWFNTNNPKAVRNRLRLVTRELTKNLKKIHEEKRGISIMSIASGSSRAVADALFNTTQAEIAYEVAFLDKNKKAHDYSKKLVDSKKFGPNYKFSWIEESASSFHKFYHNKPQPDVIEMVGLLDYFDDKKAENIFREIYKNLADDGVFITANIRDNSERPFVSKLVGWQMIYREPEDIHAIALRAGFKAEDIEIFIEPMCIHFVMVAKKTKK